MTAVDPAALRELAQGLTVPTIAEAELGCRAIDGDGKDVVHAYAESEGWNWSQVHHPYGASRVSGLGAARVTHAPVSVEQLAAVRAALEGAAAELEQARAERDAANAQAAKLAGEQSVDRDQIARLLDLCVEADGDLTERTAERDRAREAAAALKAECAELRKTLTAIRDRGACAVCNSDEAARAVLARTDPLRAEAEGGEERG